MFKLAAILVLALFIPHSAVNLSPYAQNIARAEEYLVRRLNPNLGLVYESDDPGTHWLTSEYPSFHWRYNQTYWLYSDNLFASLALQKDYPEISSEINASMNRYHEPASEVFEVLEGKRIQLPLHAAQDYIVAQGADYVVTIRRHNSTALAFNWLDLWMYEALEYDLEGNYQSAQFLLRRTETMWNGSGFWEWSVMLTRTFSNHKLALFLFTARALGITVPEEDMMLQHLWSMQNQYGGITTLSDIAGHPIGSSNTETTALALLIYDQSLLDKFPKAHLPSANQTSLLLASTIAIAVLLAATLFKRKRDTRTRLTRTRTFAGGNPGGRRLVQQEAAGWLIAVIPVGTGIRGRVSRNGNTVHEPPRHILATYSFLVACTLEMLDRLWQSRRLNCAK